VRITSPDPAVHPQIWPGYFAAAADRACIVAGMRMARRIAAAPALAPYVEREIKPGPDVDDETALMHYARATAGTVFHPVGTCKMGADQTAVVDSALRVRGIAGLRVVDASVMPTLVSGNTNAATIMIAEKGAAMILDALDTPSRLAG
jgi:choline dehydrogenase